MQTLDGFSGCSVTDHSRYEQDVINWIAEWLRCDSRGIKPETCLNRGITGLGINGDDGKELIEFLQKQSGVSFDSFDLDKYFGPEVSIAAAIFAPREFLRGLRGPNLSVKDLALFMHQNSKK
jgi:hypothetical protein